MSTTERMLANSVKQALDGQRREIALFLKPVLCDLAQDYSDLSETEQLAVYKALIEDLLRDVERAGINPEKFC